ncbi:hypothetical protein EA187_13985 [Lujinxingia sediminis]|uniref:HTTM domain-containing protein n=1 Tax=Lujinxingia sediminis TaxID=2480984 RepID=A0ABY0CRR2_9DELT|nr:hypothetical protein [Lujinxingia sediminis]RVU42943.1 hypothetical protein EA187_13985 [Lujinxingia sediminis]
MFQTPLNIVLSWHPQGPPFRLMALLFSLAGLCHLWLADAWIPEWLAGNALFLLGILALPFSPSLIPWASCALGKALPLLMGRDHLNQSLLLMLIATAALLLCALGGWRAARRPDAHNPAAFDTDVLSPTPTPTSESELTDAFFHFVRGLTVAVYAMSAFHKLNRDFIDPTLSCASYGVDKLAGYLNLSLTDLPGGLLLRELAPAVVIAAELGIALLYVAGRRKAALVIALLFHIPLTLTMAPAFAFVMLIGHAAFLTTADLRSFAERGRRFGPLIIGAALTMTALTTWMHGGSDDWTMLPREALLWGLLIWVALTPLSPRHLWRTTHAGQPTSRTARRLATLAVALYLIHALTPYLGLRFQHTAAMVSNLRIDQGCWNHLVMPERWRLREEYIRVDRVYFREPGFIVEYENKVLDQLWNTTQVRQMRRNWCRDEVRPFYLEGTWRGEPFVIDDLCAAPLSWPFERAGVWGEEVFEDHLRFQRNLPRTCPAACIH